MEVQARGVVERTGHRFGAVRAAVAADAGIVRKEAARVTCVTGCTAPSASVTMSAARHTPSLVSAAAVTALAGLARLRQKV